jgi:hypothetical protein
MEVLAPLHFVPLLGWLGVAAVFLALLEIEIEGGTGWAKSLPTWRYGPPWIRRLLNGKDLTGYHLYLSALLLLLVHLPVLFIGWSPALELTILSAFLTFAVLWDALWFALNPAIDRNRRAVAWWFRSWLGPFPTDYYVGLALAAALASLRGALPDAPLEPALAPLAAPFQHLVGWAAGTVVAAGIAVVATVVGRQVRRAPHVPSFVITAAEARARTEGAARPVLVGLRQVTTARPADGTERDDPLVALVAQEERLRKAQWLVQFAEILFGILIGLSLQRISASNLFNVEDRSLAEMLVLGTPLILLYAWVVYYVILYWFHMRVEIPVFAVFIRQVSGIQHLVLVVVLGLIFFQAFDSALVDFATATPADVAAGVDRVIGWLGILVVFDLVAQAYLRQVWLRSIDRLERGGDPTWAPFLPRIRRYYGRLFPIKTIGLAIVYVAFFFPGLPGPERAYRYPLLTALGVTTAVVVAAAFVAVNLAFELYLQYQRRIVHEVAARLAVELRRLDFAEHEGAAGLIPGAEAIVGLDTASDEVAEPGSRVSAPAPHLP